MPLTGPAARPVDPAAFAARLDGLGPFERSPHLAVGVSGGPDSLALAILADAWVRTRGGRLTALTVDHGLRPESGAEAVRVASWLAARGIDHVILRWQGPKPATGVQVAARAARHALLADWCTGQGVLHLLLAHHADDQRETAAIRAGRGSGPDGLAGMPAVRELERLRLLRPLLDEPKAALEATCRAHGQDWVVDPGNADPRFARGRLRATAADLPAPEAVRLAGLDRGRLDDAAAGVLAERAVFHPEGWIELDHAAMREGGPDVAARILARCVMAVGGQGYPPRRERLDRLLADLRSGAAAGARTLAGAVIVPAATGWRIVREPGAVAGPVTIPGDGTVRWDGRFLVTVRGLGAVEVGALGPEDWALLKAAAPRALPSAVGRALPAIRRNGRITRVPHLGIGATNGDVGHCAAWFAPPEPVAGPRFSVV